MQQPKRAFRALALVGAIGLAASFLQMIPQSASAADTTPQPFSSSASQTTFIAQAVQCSGAAAGTTGCEQLFTAVRDAVDPDNPDAVVATSPHNLGTAVSFNYNAIAYRLADNYIYAIANVGAKINGVTVSNHLLRIGQGSAAALADSDPSNDIVIQDLGLPAGMSASDNINSGTFGGPNAAGTAQDTSNVMFLRLGTGSGSQKIWTLDFANCAAGFTAASCVTAKAGQLNAVLPNSADMSYTDGYLWSVSAKQKPTNGTGSVSNWQGIWRINPITFQAQVFAAPLDTTWTAPAGAKPPYTTATLPKGLVVTQGGYGAQWVFGNGNLGVSNNETGWIYQIKINNPTSSTPTFDIIETVPGPSSVGNDGTASPGIPIDLGVDVQVPQAYVPGQDVTFTITVTNNGTNQSGVPDANQSSEWVLDADLSGLINDATGITAGDITGLPDYCTITDTTLHCANAPELAKGGTADITFTIPGDKTAATPPQNLTVSATVSGSAHDYNTTNDTDAATAYPEIISLVKSHTDGTTFGNVGDTVAFTLTATNGGSDPAQQLDHVTLIDDGAVIGDPCTVTADGTTSTASNGSITLAAGASVTCPVTYAVTQADLNAGKVINNASVKAWAKDQPTSAVPVEASASDQVEGAGTSGIELTKTASASSNPLVSLDQTVTFSFSVKNTGTVSLHNIVISDSMTGVDMSACNALLAKYTAASPLAPGATSDVACQATYHPTQGDFAKGQISNAATVTADPPTGANVPPATDDDTTTIGATPSTGLQVTKTPSVDVVSTIGQQIAYSFTVKNTGTVQLTNVTLSDPMFGGTICTIPVLDAGQTYTGCDAKTYTTVQADFTKGSISNTVTATGTLPSDLPAGSNLTNPTDTDTATVTTAQVGSISLTKSATPRVVSEPGDTVTYTLVATNNGTVQLNNVKISDPTLAAQYDDKDPLCEFASLAPGQSTDPDACTFTYTVGQDYFTDGGYTNVATVVATDANGNDVSSSASILVTTNRRASVKLIKSSDQFVYSYVGQKITYTFNVINQGNVPLTDLVVSDPLFATAANPDGIITDCDADTVAAGDDPTCTATYEVTQEDIDRGFIKNDATVEGNPPDGMPPVKGGGGTTIVADQKTGIDIEKTADVSSVAAVGDPITYSFSVKNTGNVTLTNVTVSDPLLSNSPVCVIASLAPGVTDTTTCADLSYPVTQADIDAGSVVNTATATGTPPPNSTLRPPTDTDKVTTPATQTPKIDLIKTVDNAYVTDTTQPIEYTFLVTNTGNVTLSNVNVTDALPGIVLSSNCAALGTAKAPSTVLTLAPDESDQCTATYMVTQADINAGEVVNAATATGTPPKGSNVTDDDSVIVTVAPQPGISITKTVASSTTADGVDNLPITDPGDVYYNFTITNTGNVTLDNLVINDDMLGDAVCASTLADKSLAPDASIDCQVPYTVTQAKFEGPAFTNTATATGSLPTGMTPATVTSEPDTATVTPVANPGITLNKLVNDQKAIQINGSVAVTYTFEITNSGNVTLHGITLSDAMLDDVFADATKSDCGAALADQTLAPEASTTCSATFLVTQAKFDAGEFTNTATATGTLPTGMTDADGNTTTTSNDSSATVTPVFAPELTLTKSPDKASVGTAGDIVTYTFTLTNDGNVTLHNFAVSETAFNGLDADGNAAAIDLTDCNAKLATESLAPGESTDCLATYAVSQNDITAGGPLVNKATATGLEPDDETPVTSNEATGTVAVIQTPLITLDKSVQTTAVITAAGQKVVYAFTVTNDGNVPLTNVTVKDPMFVTDDNPDGVVCGPYDTLAVNQVIDTCTAEYTVTQDDMDAGMITNAATVTGTSPKDEPVTDNDEVNVPVTQTPGISLVKTNNATNITLGQDVVYTFTVKNTGNVTLTDVTVTDALFDDATAYPQYPGGVICTIDTLAPGDTAAPCTATYKVTQADMDNGKLTNAATATGTPPNGLEPPESSSNITNNGKQNTAIQLTKVPDPRLVSTTGTVQYEFTLKNIGNVTLSAVSITDSKLGADQVASCNKQLANKLAAAAETAAPGTPYGLAPGDSVSCTADYTVQPEDLNADTIVNNATATGVPPAGLKPPQGSARAIVIIDRQASITLTKNPDVGSVSAVGDPVVYTFTVTNTSTVPLNDVTLSDPMFVTADHPSDVICTSFVSDVSGETVSTLQPDESATCQATYLATQADLDNGFIYNTATVTGQPPTGMDEVSASANATVGANQTTGLTLEKHASSATADAAGDTITYTFTVTNTGNTTLTNVVVSDPMFGGPICTINKLDPGVPVTDPTCSKTYTVTQADVDAGSIVNTATATGTPPPGLSVPPDDSNVTVTIDREPGISIVKSASPTTVTEIGDTITYSLIVTNTGNTTLTNVTVTDTKAGTVTCPTTTLQASGSTDADGVATDTMTCTATYQATAADFTAGTIHNVASVEGTPPSGLDKVTDTDSADVNAMQNPAIELVKSSTTTVVNALGQRVPYTLTVTNTGNVDLSGVTVKDPKAITATNTDGTVCSFATLAVGAHQDCSFTYTVTQADLDAYDTETGLSQLVNTAVATGTGPKNGTPTEVSDESTVKIPVDQEADITVTKVADVTSVSQIGDPVTYLFTVENTGNVTLKNVTVTDAMFDNADLYPDYPDGVVCTIAQLVPGVPDATCSATYYATADDFNNGTIHNTATATGTPPDVSEPPTDVTHEDVDTDQQPAISLVKTATQVNDGDTPLPDLTVTEAGQTVSYNFLVTNTGNVTLSNISINDPKIADVSCPSTTLAEGDSMTCTATYTVTDADLANDTIDNTATVTGTGPNNGTTKTVKDTDDEQVPVEHQPELTLTKSASLVTDGVTASQAGDKITYTFTVENTGNIPLTDVTVTDPLLGDDWSCTIPGTLQPGASDSTCTATYATTQDDWNAGEVSNTALVTGTPPSGPQIPPTDDTVVTPLPESPSIHLDKAVDPSTDIALGDELTYTFTITNTGNVTLSDVTLDDSFLPSASMSDCNTALATLNAAGGLVPGADPFTCEATYTVQQSDIDGGDDALNATVYNEAATTGTSPKGKVVDSSAQASANGSRNTSITLTKSASTDTFDAADETITYSFVVKNTGNTTLKGFTVNDPMLGGQVCDITEELAPGASSSASQCSVDYTTTQDDVNAGSIHNTATAVGKPQDGLTPPRASDDNIVASSAQASIQLDKASVPADVKVTHVGQVVDYLFTVTNAGPVTLKNVTVIDQYVDNTNSVGVVDGCEGLGYLGTDPDDPTATINVLQPGETVTCKGSYTATQADIDRGSILNMAEATGQPPAALGMDDVHAFANYTVGVTQETSITLDKVVTDPANGTVTNPAQPVTYGFTIKNTGNVTLTGVTLTDTSLPGIDLSDCTTKLAALDHPTDANAIPGLAPGASVNCVGVYNPADNPNAQKLFDDGGWTNNASVTGEPPTGSMLEPPTDTGTAIVTAEGTPGLSVDKAANVTEITQVGQVVTYTFTVTNTGTLTMHDFTLTDTMPAGMPALDMSNCDSVIAGYASADNGLAPGDSFQCIGTVTVTQAMFDAGSVLNSVEIKGRVPDGETPPPGPGDEVEIDVPDRDPGISLEKTATQIQNASGTITWPTANETPALIANAGDIVTYTFTVTNTGNVTLTSPVLTDSKLSEAQVASCNAELAQALADNAETAPAGTPYGLAPHDSISCHATYTATQQDILNGTVTNAASVTATPPTGLEPPTPGTDTEIVNATPRPAFTLAKVPTPTQVNMAGQVVVYTFTARNTGNVPLTNVQVTDTRIATAQPVCTMASLPVGGTASCTARYTVTQADIEASGTLYNVATATATPPSGPDVPNTTPPIAYAIVGLSRQAAVTLDKDVSPATVPADGGWVTYSFTVTNTGHVNLSNIRITDDELGGAVCQTALAGVVLAPANYNSQGALVQGESTTCTQRYFVTPEDLGTSGTFTNTASVAASSVTNGAVASDSAKVTASSPAAIYLSKSASTYGVFAAGDQITYTLNVLNSGSLPLSNVFVYDPMFADLGSTYATSSCSVASLDPGESMPPCVETYTVTPEDIANGQIYNNAAAYGTAPTGDVAMSTADVTVGVLQFLSATSFTTFSADDPSMVPLVQTGAGDVSATGTDAVTSDVPDATDQAQLTSAVSNNVSAPDSDQPAGSQPNAAPSGDTSPTGPSATTGGTVATNPLAALPWAAGACGIALLLWFGFRRIRHMSTAS